MAWNQVEVQWLSRFSTWLDLRYSCPRNFPGQSLVHPLLPCIVLFLQIRFLRGLSLLFLGEFWSSSEKYLLFLLLNGNLLPLRAQLLHEVLGFLIDWKILLSLIELAPNLTVFALVFATAR